MNAHTSTPSAQVTQAIAHGIDPALLACILAEHAAPDVLAEALQLAAAQRDDTRNRA